MSQDIHRGGLLKQRALQIALMNIRGVATNSICVRRRAAATTVMKSKQRSRRCLKNRLVNWRKKKRHMQMASRGTRFLPSVVPTDRPPPSLTTSTNMKCTCIRVDID
ncbi:hypothetical protein Bpfe_011502, partial [Biomphalaria pfeifferi]